MWQFLIPVKEIIGGLGFFHIIVGTEVFVWLINEATMRTVKFCTVSIIVGIIFGFIYFKVNKADKMSKF